MSELNDKIICRGNGALFRSQVGPILLLTGIFFLNFTSRIILSPLMPTIEKDLGITHGQAGSLFVFTSVGYCISLLAAGAVSSRLMHGRTIAFSAIAVGIALLGISCSKGLWGMRLGLFFLGLAAGLYLPSGIATLTSLISFKDWGKGIAIHELAPNLSFVAAPLISEALLPWFSWQGILALIGGISLLTGTTFVLFGKGGGFPGQAPSLESFRELLAKPSFWIMALLFSLAIGGSMGVFAMLPLYLVAERGIVRNWANTLVSMSRISGVGIAFAAGWATDRFGPKRIMAAVFLLTGIMTILLGLAADAWIIIIVFLQPMLAVCFFPAGFAALSSIAPSNARNMAVSLAVPFAFLVGGGVIPAGIGVFGDTGSFASGFAVVGALITTGFLLSLCLKLPVP